MSYRYIEVTHADRVTMIALNRPEVMNAIHEDMHWELHQAFDAFAGDDEKWICVLTGNGEKAFCAGSDLKFATNRARQTGSAATNYPPSGYGGLAARFDLNKPVIAAVNGHALGGGFEIALTCDVIVATDHASFGLPEPLVGNVAHGGGIHRLVRQIGLKPAMGMLLTGARVDAAEGLRLGFVNEVVPFAELSSAVSRWTSAMLRCAPLALRATKELARQGLENGGIDAAIRQQEASEAFQALRRSRDALEGPAAFAEKRPPLWSGN